MPLLDPLSSVYSSLKQAHLIPALIPPSFFPSAIVSIKWPTGQEALLGNQLTTLDTADEPSIEFVPLVVPAELVESGSADDTQSSVVEPGDISYTLIMIDPDVPSRMDPKYSQFRHWVISALKSPAASASAIANISAIHTQPAITPYHPPAPTPGTGVHRYVFLLFQQPTSPTRPLSVDTAALGSSFESRQSWNALEFAQDHGLKLIGVNFFVIGAEE